MTTIVKELYDALIEAGVKTTTAEKAANTLSERDERIINIEKDLHLLKWMVGYLVAICTVISVKYLIP